MQKKISLVCWVLFCLVGLNAFAADRVAAEKLRLSVAASLTDAFKQLVADYQMQNPDVTLLPNFASSGALAKQIAAGAPADIYISANPKWLQFLQEQGLIAADAAQILAHNSLVFVGQPGTAVKTLDDLSKLEKLALCSPKSSPAGRYAEQAMSTAGIYAELRAASKLVLAKDVRQALLYADRGEVDGAFVYHTDALLAQQAKILFTVPPHLYPQVTYPAAVTMAGAGSALARGFFDYLFSVKARQILEHHGFLLPGS